MAEVAVQGVTVPKDATVSSRPDLFGVRNQFRPDGQGGILSRIVDDRPEYATPEASGITGGFYVGDRGLPWHVALAKQLNTPELMSDAGQLLNKEAALAAAGSFEVGLVPVYVDSPNEPFKLEIPGKFATVREDTGAPLGIVGRGYKVFQERALAELADNIVDIGAHLTPVFETGGHMRDGAWFFLSMELKGLDITVPGDPSDLQTYLLLMTSHDGSKPAGYFVTQVRTVCRNTADLAQKGALRTYRIRHTGSLEGKAIEARKALGIALNSAESVKALTERLALTNLVDSQVKEIFAKTWPVKASEDSPEDEEVKNRHAERAFALYEASPNLEGIRGTAWGAVNAVTEYLDHGIEYHGRKRQSNGDARADSILFGSSHDAKERAIKAALVLAK